MLEKLFLQLAASQLTVATLHGQPAASTIQDQEKLVAQTQVDWYEWLRATIISASWPTPQIDMTLLSNAIRAALVTGQATGTVPPLSTAGPVAPSKAMSDPHLSSLCKISPANPKGTP